MPTWPRSCSSARRPPRATYGISSRSWRRIPVHMQSPSPSDRPSSTSPADPGARAAAPTRIVQVGGLAALSVAVTAIAFALAATAFSDPVALLVAGVATLALVGALAAHAVQRDARRLQASEEWQRRLRGELMSQAAFLD